jgi:hypothetical protein
VSEKAEARAIILARGHGCTTSYERPFSVTVERNRPVPPHSLQSSTRWVTEAIAKSPRRAIVYPETSHARGAVMSSGLAEVASVRKG